MKRKWIFLRKSTFGVDKIVISCYNHSKKAVINMENDVEKLGEKICDVAGKMAEVHETDCEKIMCNAYAEIEKNENISNEGKQEAFKRFMKFRNMPEMWKTIRICIVVGALGAIALGLSKLPKLERKAS